MRIAVVGAGGVGGYFGGRLAQTDHDVTFIARGEHLSAMLQEGLRVESIDGDFAVSPVQATDNPEDVGAVDLVIIGVKAWQIPGTAVRLGPMLGPDTLVLPLQNGLEASSQLAEALGPAPVLGGLCAIYSFITAPGCIRHIGIDPAVTFGALQPGQAGRLADVQAALQQAGITANTAPDIRVPLWEKFLVLRWGVVGAVARVPAGVLRRLPQARDMIDKAGREVLDVAETQGIGLPADTLRRSSALLDSLPAGATTSLQRDVMEGRPSELDAQAGALVRLGEQIGVATPLHAFIYHSLLPMEMQARGEIGEEM
jgi:2-dehydropantoate 2-reductase